MVLLTSLLITCLNASAVPSVHIESPIGGSVLTSSDVVVSGTATGSDTIWGYGGTYDFRAGVSEGLVIEAEALQLSRTVQDDFNDNSINATTWLREDVNGINSVEESQHLRQYGTSVGPSYWSAGARLTSKAVAGDCVEATLKSISGSGTGWGSMMALVQDSRNSVCVGVNYDPGQWGTSQVYIYYTLGRNGVQTKGTIEVYDGLSHQFKIIKSGSGTEIDVDGANVMTVPFTLTNPVVRFATPARVQGDTVDVVWDNVVAAFVHQGNFTSAVHDSKAVDPLLKRLDWISVLPTGTGMTVELRSSDTINMGTPTAWTTVSNGQTVGLPVVKRYLQFRALLLSITGLETPEFRDISVQYHTPVKRVEVSLDSSSWVVVSGTALWNATFHLVEGTSVVYVKVIDAAGAISFDSISLDVDLSPPVGSLLIDNGAEITATRDVTLSLAASDKYGVLGMRASASPDFTGVDWVPFATSMMWSLSGGDGPKTIYVMFKDSNGWVSKVVNDSIVLDTTAPVGTVSIDDGANYTRSRDVILSFEAQDIIGVVDMRVWEDGDIATRDWEPFNATRGFQISSGDGPKVVLAEFRDRAGHVSVAASDTIILDTIAPMARVTINHDDMFTNSTRIMLEIILDEANLVDVMQMSEDATMASASWEAPETSTSLVLSDAEGLKTVYVRGRDAAGNVGDSALDTITLDTIAPVVQMGEVGRKSPTPAFNVSWLGSDATNGLAGYDVQFRDGTGPWTEWFKGTNMTQALFMGEDGHNYSFHARAIDLAGNSGEYAAPVYVRVLIPFVSVTIDEPLEGATVEGNVVIRGNSSHTDPEIGVGNVSISVDGGKWMVATGTAPWTFELDTDTLANGIHVIRVMAHDGVRDSQEVVLSLNVDNPEPIVSIFGWLIIIMIIVAVIITISLLVWHRSKKV